MNFLRLSEFFSWIAIGAVVLCQNGVLGPIWPLVFGFAWLFARLYGAPIVEDAYLYLVLSLLLFITVAAYTAVSSKEPLTLVLLLKAQSGIGSALLALGYGVASACIVSLVMMRAKPRELGSGTEQVLEKIDATTFGTNTDRKPNLIFIFITLIVVVSLLYLLLR